MDMYALHMEYPVGLVAQWITRLTTDQKIPGSNPGKLVIFRWMFSWNCFVDYRIYC